MKPLTVAISISLLFLPLLVVVAMVPGEEHADNYLVFVNPTPPGVACLTYHLGILTAALGSEEKAKSAIVYNYRNVVSGFSVRATPSELDAIKKQPQVTRVLPSATLQLMSSNFDDVS